MIDSNEVNNVASRLMDLAKELDDNEISQQEAQDWLQSYTQKLIDISNLSSKLTHLKIYRKSS